MLDRELKYFLKVLNSESQAVPLLAIIIYSAMKPKQQQKPEQYQSDLQKMGLLGSNVSGLKKIGNRI